MVIQYNQLDKREGGFTIIEFMSVVAIIGILAAIAVPKFLSHRCKSRMVSIVGAAEGIRAAFASFAADSQANRYPTMAEISNYATMVPTLNAYGGSLTQDPGNLKFISYTTTDANGDTLPDNYEMRLQVRGISAGTVGFEIFMTPGGIWRCPNAGDVPPTCIN